MPFIVRIQYASNPYLDRWPASALDVYTSWALLLFRREVAIICKANIICQNKIKDSETVLCVEQW